MRVIQDSDDEFEEEVEVDAPHPAGIGVNASTHAKLIQDVSSASGTGSTESLKRAFAEAHRNHLQNPSVPSGAVVQEELQSSVPLPELQNKRRKTSIDVTAHVSQTLLSPRRGLITDAKRSKSVLSSPSAGSANEGFADFLNQTRLHSAVKMPWNLDCSIGDDLAQHEPNVLFPEPSSTIPNATLTQQRVLEGVTGPTLLGTDGLAASTNRAPEPSVPWSDIMKFTPGDPAENTEPSGQQGDDGMPLDLVGLDKIEEAFPLPSSSQDLGRPSVVSKSSQQASPYNDPLASHAEESKLNLDINLEDDLVAMGLPKEQYMPRPSRSRSLKADTQVPVDYSVRPEKAARSAKRRKTTTAAATTRSSGVTDVTTTPQKVQQICEMGFTPTSTRTALKKNNGDIAQTVEWLVNHGMGEDELAPHYTPKRKLASKKLTKDLEGATLNVQLKVRTLQESSSQVADSEQCGKVHMAMNSSTSRGVVDIPKIGDKPTMPEMVAQVENQQVQVVIPAKSPNAPSPSKPNVPKSSHRKAKRRKTTLDIPECDTPIETVAVSEMTTIKKKGRGRPKKDTSALPVGTTNEQAPATANRHTEQPHMVLQTIEATLAIENLAAADTSPTSCKRTISNVTCGDNAQGHESTPTTDLENPIAAAPSRIPDQTVKTSGPSPAIGGKVSYRVGLSKRARIAPLLRIIKK